MVINGTDFAFLNNETAQKTYTSANYEAQQERGLNESVIERISIANRDPYWLRDLRYAAFDAFQGFSEPLQWAPDILSELDLDDLAYYNPLEASTTNDWNQLSDPVRQTLDDLNLRQEEESILGGLKVQFDSSIAFSSLNQRLEEQGIIFVDSVTGLRDYESLFRKAFGSLIAYDSNKFAALNTAVFTGGAFLYIPAGVKVALPLKSYFRMNAANCGQFGRTLIILEEDAELVFMEGCSAADHSSQSLHASVGEIIAHPRSNLQYITFQNWSHNVFNLVQMRARADTRASVKWLDCNIGGKLTMKYPSTQLAGKGASSEIVSIGIANEGQHQDTGGKMLHQTSDTHSSIVSKSISLGTGQASYRGLVDFDSQTSHCTNNTECDALLINTDSRTATYPSVIVSGQNNSAQHEASVSKISEEQIFYLQQRGLSKNAAMSLSINGFINDLVREFPIEYSAPLKHLVDLKMEGSIG
ncbi:Fe-S cluster assembly protein SufB [Coraliomargarita sp. W4R53]